MLHEEKELNSFTEKIKKNDKNNEKELRENRTRNAKRVTKKQQKVL